MNDRQSSIYQSDPNLREPQLGEAAIASWSFALSFSTTFEPIRPVPPITTIFITNLLSSLPSGSVYQPHVADTRLCAFCVRQNHSPAPGDNYSLLWLRNKDLMNWEKRGRLTPWTRSSEPWTVPRVHPPVLSVHRLASSVRPSSASRSRKSAAPT